SRLGLGRRPLGGVEERPRGPGPRRAADLQDVVRVENLGAVYDDARRDAACSPIDRHQQVNDRCFVAAKVQRAQAPEQGHPAERVTGADSTPPDSPAERVTGAEGTPPDSPAERVTGADSTPPDSEHRSPPPL